FSKLLLALAIPSGLVVKSLGDDALESESIQPISLNFPNRQSHQVFATIGQADSFCKYFFL
ncbi:putative Protein FAM160B1 protein, partial [Naja naja]